MPGGGDGSGVTEYGYDNAGNRTQSTVEGVVTTFGYDERNRLASVDADGTVSQYSWDPRGTLATVAAGSQSTGYSFDNLGRLVGVDDGAVPVSYTYDGLGRVANRNGTQPFSYAGAGIDPTGDSLSTVARSPGGTIVGIDDNGAQTLLAGLDRHGDLTVLFNNDLSVNQNVDFDPFGDPEGGSTDTAFGFQGDWTDPTTGDVWQGARWYTPNTATFRSRDTIRGELRTPVTLNRYTYANNNPNKYWDPNGQIALEGPTAPTRTHYAPQSPRNYRKTNGTIGHTPGPAKTTRTGAAARRGGVFSGAAPAPARPASPKPTPQAKRIAEINQTPVYVQADSTPTASNFPLTLFTGTTRDYTSDAVNATNRNAAPPTEFHSSGISRGSGNGSGTSFGAGCTQSELSRYSGFDVLICSGTADEPSLWAQMVWQDLSGETQFCSEQELRGVIQDAGRNCLGQYQVAQHEQEVAATCRDTASCRAYAPTTGVIQVQVEFPDGTRVLMGCVVAASCESEMDKYTHKNGLTIVGETFVCPIAGFLGVESLVRDVGDLSGQGAEAGLAAGQGAVGRYGGTGAIPGVAGRAAGKVFSTPVTVGATAVDLAACG